MSNYSSSSVTISWITDTRTDGSIEYGLHSGVLDEIQEDNRGSVTDNIHYVTITGLEQETTYDYKVVSGGISLGISSFTTTKVGVGIPYTIYGIIKYDGVTPAKDAIVYVTVKHDDTTSYPLSKLTNSNGQWHLSLGNLKSPDTNDVFSWNTEDVISVSSLGMSDSTGFIEDVVSGNSPQRISLNLKYVSTPWDVNDDNIVDISDLVIVGSHFGEVGSVGDLNNDGRIDIIDLDIVSSHLGEKYSP